MSVRSFEGETRALPEAHAWLATVRIAADTDPARWSAAIECRPPDIHPAEWLEAETLTDSRRRMQWLAGRRAVKRALSRALAVAEWDPASLAVRSRDRFGKPVRPSVWSRGARLDLHVSISHGEQIAAAVVSPIHAMGVDVVESATGGDPDAWTWSAREAAYKASAGHEAFVPEDWRIEHAEARAHGTAIHRRAPGRRVRVSWIGDVAGAHVIAVGFSSHERSSE